MSAEQKDRWAWPDRKPKPEAPVSRYGAAESSFFNPTARLSQPPIEAPRSLDRRRFLETLTNGCCGD